GKADDAAPHLDRSAQSRDAEVRYRALFNLGLLYLRRARGAKADDAAAQAFAAAADAYKRALRLRPSELDAKWNYELALRHPKSGGGGGGGGSGGGGQSDPQEAPPSPERAPQPRPAGSLDPGQAEQLLNSAAREERDVQGKKQKQSRPDRPPGGKDW
ncbi:MAG: hypothetical protein WKG32_11070, partial [Gemmatimonadaceae bacterium]